MNIKQYLDHCRAGDKAVLNVLYLGYEASDRENFDPVTRRSTGMRAVGVHHVLWGVNSIRVYDNTIPSGTVAKDLKSAFKPQTRCVLADVGNIERKKGYLSASGTLEVLTES